MTWICTKCNAKNNNSSIKCRKNKCHTPKPEQVKIKQIQKEQKNYVRDLCPNCKIHTDFTRIRKNEWSCGRCHKLCRFRGKPVPEKINNNESSETL